MPTCPHCDVAYLPGEQHVCTRPAGRGWRTLGVSLLIVGVAVFLFGFSFYIFSIARPSPFSIGSTMLALMLAPAGVVLAFIGTVLVAMFRK